MVENDGSDIRFVESIFPPQIEEADIPDRINLNSSIVLHAAISNPTSLVIVRPVRVELIQDGLLKGWSQWVDVTFGSEETIDLDMSVDRRNCEEVGIAPISASMYYC